MPKVTRIEESVEKEEPVQLSLFEEPEAQEEDVPQDAETDEIDNDGVQAIEDLDPDIALWDGGPTAAQAVAWKEKHGDVYVTSVTTDMHVAWRTITRSEFKLVVKQIEKLVAEGGVSQAEAEMINEELICQICALYPRLTERDFAGSMAGLPSILSQQILSASGFTSIDVIKL